MTSFTHRRIPTWVWLAAVAVAQLPSLAAGGPNSPLRLAGVLVVLAAATFAPAQTFRLTVALQAALTAARHLQGEVFPQSTATSVFGLLVVWVSGEMIARTVGALRQVRAELHDSHTRWHTVFKHHPDPFVMHDLDGLVLEINETASAQSGITHEAVAAGGVNWLRSVPLLDVDYDAIIAKVRGGEVVTWTSRMRHAGDGLRDLEGSSLPVVVDGQVQAVMVALKDVTARNLGMAEVASIQQALDHLAEPVAIYEQGADRFLYVNRQAATLLGAPAAELIGQPASVLGHLRQVAIAGGVSSAEANAADGKVVVREMDWPTADGTVRLEIRFQTLSSHGREVVVVVCHDVSAFQEALDVERRAVERLRDVDEIKNAFLSAVSHELRTPLTVVRGMAATMTQHAASLTAEQVESFSGRIEAQARRLDGLLSDLLDVDRLARGAIVAERSEVDIAATIATIVEEHPVAVVDAQIAIASVDAAQFERVVVNLLTNAQKYAGGADLLRLLPAADLGVEIVVADRGPGIDDVDRSRIFQAFERLDRDHPSPGTGIGLSMVAQFAALHGGRAWVEGREGGGTEIHVLFPGAPAEAPTPAA